MIRRDNVKEGIRNEILKLGANVCGFASMKRFENAPKGFHPADIYEGCKTAIVHTYGKNKRGFSTVDCNQCKTVCPMRFGVRR